MRSILLSTVVLFSALAASPPTLAQQERSEFVITDVEVQVLTLLKEAREAPTSRGYESVRRALAECGGARKSPSRRQICMDAQKRIDDCNAYNDWEGRKNRAIADAERQYPGIGQGYTEGMSKLRGVGPQPNRQQRFNDYVYQLRGTKLEPCPSSTGVYMPRSKLKDDDLGSYELTPLETLKLWDELDADAAKLAMPKRPPSSASAAFQGAIEDADAKEKAEEKAAADEQERLKAEADAKAKAAAAEEARLKAEADRRAKEEADFKKKLATDNAGQLYALGDELEDSGDKDRSRQAFRALIARFPNHALAATAAQRLSGEKSAAGGSASSHSTGSGSKSVCYRNAEKFEDDYEAAGVKMYAATYDLFYAEIQLLTAKLWEPCLGSDPNSKEYYDKLMQSYRNVQTHCAGSHSPHECTQWGAGGHEQDHMAALDWSRQEVQRLLAASGGAGGENSSRSPSGGNRDGGDANPASGAPGKDADVTGPCRDGVARLELEASAINGRKPTGAGPVAASQVALYIIRKRMQFLDSSCKGQPEYKQYAGLKKAYDDTVRTCEQVASGVEACVPKLAW